MNEKTNNKIIYFDIDLTKLSMKNNEKGDI